MLEMPVAGMGDKIVNFVNKKWCFTSKKIGRSSESFYMFPRKTW
jgi:hypothetical protein